MTLAAAARHIVTNRAGITIDYGTAHCGGKLDTGTIVHVREGASMSLFEDTNPRELKELLSQIHTREAALPDFQRDFVWDPNATQELIVSIASNYPAGSLLRIRNTHNLFACREVQGAPSLKTNQPTYLVLDGQQRLTSLYQAFYGVGEHRYFIDLRRLIEGGDFDECLFHLRSNVKRAMALEDVATQERDLILPLSVLSKGAGGFLKWSKAVLKAAPTLEEADELDAFMDDVYERWIQTIDDYRFPVVTLSDQTDAEAVCTIFETLNRTGVKLSPFELLTARFWPKNVNLRQLWAQTQEDHPIIADFAIDPYYLLQAVSLVARPTPSCKRGDVLDLEADAIREWWKPCARGLARGLAILRDDCGVITPSWMPIFPVLVTLAAVEAKVGTPTGPEQSLIRQRIRRWFWCFVLGGKYESGPNSQAVKDFSELQAWFKEGPPPETVADFRFDPRILRDTTFRQRALYRGLICLLLQRHPRDFYSEAVLTGDLIIEHNVDDHHIFPRAYLDGFNGDEQVPARLRDCILNRTLIDRKTNTSIGKRPPSAYMGNIQAVVDDSFPELLRSHLLPTGPDSPLWRDDSANFVSWRLEAFWQEIKSLTGIQEASDLVEEEAVAS